MRSIWLVCVFALSATFNEKEKWPAGIFVVTGQQSGSWMTADSCLRSKSPRRFTVITVTSLANLCTSRLVCDSQLTVIVLMILTSQCLTTQGNYIYTYLVVWLERLSDLHKQTGTHLSPESVLPTIGCWGRFLNVVWPLVQLWWNYTEHLVLAYLLIDRSKRKWVCCHCLLEGLFYLFSYWETEEKK